MIESKIWFGNICQKNSIQISESQIDLLEKYVHHLLDWNAKINLISRKDSEQSWTQHVLSSVSLLKYYNLYDKTSILDLGTGGGLPGIPLAIMRPDIKFLLLDSIQKKVTAVQDILARLNLPNVKAICSRAEELAKQKEYYQSFDYIVVRAVAPITELVKWGKPFLKSSHSKNNSFDYSIQQKYIEPGTIVMLKGGDVSTEIDEAKIKTAFQSITIKPITLEGLDQNSLVDKKVIILKP